MRAPSPTSFSKPPAPIGNAVHARRRELPDTNPGPTGIYLVLALAYVLVVITLTCLSGIGAFALLWPRDANAPRPFRTWPLTLLVLGVSAPAIISIPIFRAEFLSDNGIAWLEWGFYAACATSLGLITAAAIGDRSRGRRRCPRCWYSMVGLPGEGGLTCPECGRTARHERSLFRSRRRKVLFVAALIPALASLLPWNAIYYRGPDWARNLSNTALVLLSPLANHSFNLTAELEESLSPDSGERRDFSSWQRGVLIRAARHAQADTTQARLALTSAQALIALEADDATTVETLVTLSTTSTMYQDRALQLLGLVHGQVPRAKAALIAALGANATSAYHATHALLALMPRAPGGPPPPALFKNLAAVPSTYPQAIVALLRWFDPTDETRAALLGALADDRNTSNTALLSLAALWPGDPEVQGKVLAAVRFTDEPGIAEPGIAEPPALRMVYMLVGDAQITRTYYTHLPANHLALYTPEICAELEKWLPRLDDNDRTYSVTVERSFGRALRQTLAEARATHAKP